MHPEGPPSSSRSVSPRRSPSSLRFGELPGDPPEQEHGAIGRLSADEELQQAVCNALIQEPELDSARLEVRAAGGVVTLTGGVRSRADWMRALRIARDQTGTRAIDAEQLRIDDA